MKRLLNNSAAANHLKVAAATLQYWRSTGTQEIPFMKIGGRVAYSLSDLDEWLDQHTYKHTGEYKAGGSNHE
ncbi:MAG: helix-turn-helix domain-containing protein [Oceanospirillaceae bacterium]|jgi:predicted DNA-binding transcriptional regulator AlpA|nr:helix-turn-helix domain-containing protein [Oceanospirillaceae bacterium]MBT4444208.1 helix-turn-helix domain-containing protein [Oceanospirillaceae bacterium]MBT5797562.1 helix-turn-helix domain-containing protein [Porticoccaceae bacterium]